MSGHEHDADMTPVVEDEKEKQKKEHGHGHSHEHDHGEEPAKIVGLGAVMLGGATFIIDREGQVAAGAKTEFGVEQIAGPPTVPSLAWLANPDGEKLCDPVKGEGHDNHWHFNVEPLEPVKKSKFVLSAGTEEVIVDWRRGAEPVNDGIMTIFKEGKLYGELKLHGDAGDLEFWLYAAKPDGNIATDLRGKPKPFDVPPNTVVRIAFPTHEGKTIELRVRNMEKNEDEAETPNMRPTGTNYFIFPGESEQDPAFLIGETVKSWRGHAVVSFEANGTSYACDPFVLVPHDAL